MDMLTTLPPGLLLLIGALIAPLLPHVPRQIWMLGVIALSGFGLWQTAPDAAWSPALQIAGLDLLAARAHAIAHPFALVFHIAAALNVIYAMHENSRLTSSAGLAYAGAAVAALHAADFATLFIYWEITAIASTAVILSRSEAADKMGIAMRYLLFHVASGMALLTAIALLWRSGASLNVGAMSADTPAAWLLLFAFGIKAAFPLLNNWLQEAYPAAGATGTVILSAFTTKLAIAMLAICFAGMPALLWAGAIMAVVAALFALLENDLKRMLAWGLNGQLGMMVIGIGIGTQLAINGAVAHAFASTLYQALLFMAVGAVETRTGTTRADRLGGLARAMPATALAAFIGSAAIAAFPFFGGYATKGMTILAAAGESPWVWMPLAIASASAVIYGFARLTYGVFGGADCGLAARDAPLNMQCAMGVAALLCIGIGLAPFAFYEILPYPVAGDPWLPRLLLGSARFVVIAAAAWWLVQRFGLWPSPRTGRLPLRPAFLRLIHAADAGARRGREAAAAVFTETAQTLARRLVACLLYTSPSPRDATLSRMPSSA